MSWDFHSVWRVSASHTLPVHWRNKIRIGRKADFHSPLSEYGGGKEAKVMEFMHLFPTSELAANLGSKALVTWEAKTKLWKLKDKTGEIIHQLRAFVIHAECSGLGAGTHIVAYNCL